MFSGSVLPQNLKALLFQCFWFNCFSNVLVQVYFHMFCLPKWKWIQTIKRNLRLYNEVLALFFCLAWHICAKLTVEYELLQEKIFGFVRSNASQLENSGLCFDSYTWLFEDLTNWKMRNLEEKLWRDMVWLLFYC